MDPERTKAITNWPKPCNSRHEIQRFMGFANYYRRFVQGFSKIAGPINELLSKDRPFVWREPQDDAFRTLIEKFTSPPMMRHFDPDLPAIIETDASAFATGAILSQHHSKTLHPVAFHSKEITNTEKNYDVHDKEMLAIVQGFKK